MPLSARRFPLTRTLVSYEAYWDRWAQTWEFQALLKARPVAGDAELGAAFLNSAEGGANDTSHVASSSCRSGERSAGNGGCADLRSQGRGQRAERVA